MGSFFKSILVPAFALAFAGLSLQACGSTGGGGGDRCVPNSTQSCTCDGTDTGVQTCSPSGTFSPCVCNPTGAGGNGGEGTGGASQGGAGGAGGAGNCHALPNTPATCGNGTVDMGEECDDGNCDPTDACNNNCKEPYCGDGVVQAPETCDGDEMCPGDCAPMMGSSSSSSGGPVDPCVGKLVVAGFASAQKGAFSYNGQIGLDAAAAACSALGGFQMCDYDQWKELEMNPMNHTPDLTKLGMLIPSGSCKTVWLHRTTPVGGACPAGPGGRCNDWNYETGHISDGETIKVCNTPAGITYEYTLDCDPTFDPMNPAPHNAPGMQCNVAYEIPCCYEKCIPMP